MSEGFEWFEYIPTDTILVRGGDEDATSREVFFPPPAQTVAGAVRTAYLAANGLDFDHYRAGKLPQANQVIGEPGKDPPFQVLGPIFLKDAGGGARIPVVPVPACWLNDKGQLAFLELEAPPPALVVASRPIRVCARGLHTTPGSLAGKWVAAEDLSRPAGTPLTQIRLFDSEALYVTDARLGVALSTSRTAREGMLYSFTHVWLRPGVGLAFGLSRAGILRDGQTFQLGAERRFGHVRRLDPAILKLPAERSAVVMALSHVPAAGAQPLCLEKVVYLGGWDLATGFSKPTRAYYPPGTVFAAETAAIAGWGLAAPANLNDQTRN